jgi:hypothetical protein
MSFDGLLSVRRPYERQVEVREPTLGEELIEVGREAFEFSPTQSIVRGLELEEARRSTNILSAESARTQLGDAGLREQLTVPDQGISQEALDILIRRKRIENQRADLYSRSPGGFGRGAAKIAASLGYSLFDPLNIATAFVPVVSQARYSAMLRAQAGFAGRTGVRAGVGFVEGTAGAALVEPLILSTARAEQADYDGADSLLNIAFGGILGGGLHAVGGAGYEAVRRLRGLEALPPRNDVDAAVQQAILDAQTELPPAPDVAPPVRIETAQRFEPTTIQPVDAYTQTAQKIRSDLNSIFDLDPNNAKQVTTATGEKAVSITEFVRRSGGIIDQGGELSARDVTNKTAPGLVRKDTPENRQIAGMDSVRERLFDAGYFPEKTDYNQITDSEIFDALAEDGAGNKVWQGSVREKLSKFISGRDYISKMEAEGFSRDMSVAQIADRLRAMDDEARADFDVAREIDPETLREYEAFAERLNAENSAVNIIDSLNPETRRAALQTGVAQAMDARNINVDTIVNLDPSLARGGEDFPLQSARNAAIENSRPDQAALVDFEAAAETPDPRRVPMLDAADSALADARAAADEAVNAVNAEGEFRRSLMVQEEPQQFGDVPVTVDNIANVEAAFDRARGKTFPNNRTFKKEIQDAVNAAATDAAVDLTEMTPAVERYLIRMAVREARVALRDNANAVGWYNEKVTKALRIISLIHPEIMKSREDRFAFTWALAVTSNGLKVDKNFELAMRAYEAWKKTGRMPTDIGIGTASRAINDSLELYNVMLKQHGFDKLENFMRSKDTVKSITGFSGLKVGGENLSTQVYGSAILGPKIGNGFFSNLYGNFEQLTIDRWLMRTWGRWTGTLIEENPAQVAAKRKSLVSLIRLLDKDERKQLEGVIGRKIALARPDEIAFAIAKASTKPANRAAISQLGVGFSEETLSPIVGALKKDAVRVGLGDEIRKAGNALAKYLDGQKEAPSGPPERARLRKVFGAALEQLQKDNPELTMADMQALLWYPEKRLYDAAGAADEAVEAGYADDAAPDYANAAAKLAEGRGISRDKIDGVTRSVDEELQAEQRARRAGRAGQRISNSSAFTVNEQLQLYLDFGPVPTQSGPRAVAAQRAAVKAVDDLRSSSDILALALSRDFAERQRVSLVGQKVSSTEDFATLAQVYRDPRFETLRYVFTDDEGNIVGQIGATSRLPASAAGFIGPDATKFFQGLADRAKELGGNNVYMLHNHPSEIATPSTTDRRFTEDVAKYLKTLGLKFKNHVIIDTNEYSVIKSDGTFQTIKKDFGQPSQLRLKRMASRPISSGEVLADLARELKFDSKSTVLVVTNNQYIVQNIVEVPQEKVMSYGSTPEEKARAMFALRKLALSSDSSFIFAVTRDYASAQAIRNVALDTIFIDESGRATSVGAAQGRGGRIIPGERRARMSPETSEAFLHLREIGGAEAIRQKAVFEEGAAYNAGDTKDQMRPFDEAIARAEMYAQAIRAAADRVGNDAAARSAMQMASKGQLTAMEIDTLLARLKEENSRVRSTLKKAQEQFTAADKIDSLEGDAIRAANSLANNIKLDATIAARNAALSLAARTKAVGRILTQFADNPSEGLLSLLGGSSFARFGSKDSAFHWQRTYFTRWTKGMLAEMERDGLVEAFASDAYSRDVARALYQMGRDEPRLEGLDPTAVKIAKIVYKYREDSRNTRNRFGAWIRDLTGYITRQQHDFMKIRAAGDKTWKDFVRQRIDVERSLKPGQNLEEFLDVVYADLSAGRHLSAIDDEAAAYTAPGSLARRASQSRVIYFKDADSEFDYLTEFGVGKLNEAILGDLSRAAQQAGLMRVLGPNPGYTLKAVMSEVEAGIVRTPELREKFADTRDTAEGLLSMLDGTANVPGKAMAARVGSNVRVVQAMAKLGGAVISAVTDLPVYASQIKYQGRGGLFSGIAEGIGGLLQGRAKGERKRILGMIDTVADNLVGSVATRFDSDDLMSAGSADLMRLFFRLNGLQWWTDTLRESMELGTANWLGSLRNTSFDGLDANAKRLFDQYGITAPEWDVIRQGVIDAADKRTYVVPERINQLDIEVFRNYLTKIGREPTDAAATTARRDLADRLRNFIIDQAMTAVIEPDIRSRYFWTRGLRPGTFWGEAARFISQFKGFPTALTRQVFGREIYGRGYGSLSEYLKYGKGDMLGLAQMILMMTAFGYIAMSAKDLLKGKTPRDPENPQTWVAAMLQGGALGIYGDFLLGQSNRYGRNIIDTLAGPTFGVIGDLDELRQRAMRGDDVAASAFRILIANTPFMNLFYSRIVLDYLVLYQIQEALNPGYLRRMERQIEREQGQEFLLAPSETVE